MLNLKKLDTHIINEITPVVAQITPVAGLSLAKNEVTRIGKIVVIQVEFYSSLSAGAYREIGTLPSGYYRTSGDFVTTGQIFLTSGAYIKVDTAGKLYVYPQNNVPSVYINFFFVLD